MLTNKLLKTELENYTKNGIDMKPILYTKNVFTHLFERYIDYGMCEHYYCCYGLSHSCWVEVVEEDVWDLTLEEVKRNILRNIKIAKRYLYNNTKYGGNRLYVGKKDGVIYVYIYLRDKLGVDYSIWFDELKI